MTVAGRRRTRIGGQFSARLIEMLESPAYRVLSLSAHRIVSRIEIELAHHGGQDNGRLPVTFDQFEDYGIHRHAISAAIREAVALGFIEITEEGRAGNADWRKPNLFRLTYRPAEGVYGDGTHDWRQFPNLDTAQMVALNARASKDRKTKTQWWKTPRFSGGKRTETAAFHSTESATTAHGAETATTIDISGEKPSLRDGGNIPKSSAAKVNRTSPQKKSRRARFAEIALWAASNAAKDEGPSMKRSRTLAKASRVHRRGKESCRRKGHRMTEIERAQELLQFPQIRIIVVMRRAGASIRSIANVFGESKSTMHRWLIAIERSERLLSQAGQHGETKRRIEGVFEGSSSQMGQQP